MPTYDYVCDACGHEHAAFQSIKADPLKTCPACGEDRLRRRIGAGAGIIFKGSGFYETDYKRARPNGKPKDGDASGGDKQDSKPEKKSKGQSDKGQSDKQKPSSDS